VIFLKGTDGRYLFVNRLYEKLFHVTNAAIQGKTDYDIFPREMAEALCRNDEVVVQTKQPFEIEERVPHDDGIHTYISIKFPIQRSSGEIYAVCGIATDITERKRAEEALRLLTHRLSVATESAGIGVWDLDLKTNHLVWDDRMYEMYGVSASDFGGAYETWQRSVHPDDLDRASREVSEAISSTRDFHTSFRIVVPDGQVRHIEAHALVLRTLDGMPDRMVGVNLDITERRQAEEALRNSESFNRAVVENSPVGISMRNAKGQLLSVNSAWMKVWELSPEEVERLINEGTNDLTSESKRRQLGQWFPQIENICRKGGVLNIPELYYDDDPPARSRWISLTYYSIMNDEGEVDRVVILTQDITVRKEAEQELEEAKTRYQEIFNGIHEGIGVVDENETILFANPALASIFEEKSPEALIGRSILDYLPDDQRAIVLEQTRKRRERHTSQYELGIVTRQGTCKTILVSVSPRLDADGRFIGSFGAVLDITERKRAEEDFQIAEEKYRTLVNNVPLSVFRSTPEGRVLSANPASVQIMGYDSEEEYCAKPAWDSYVDSHRRQELMDELQKHGFVTNFESQMIRKDGKVIWVSANATVSRSEKGDIEYIDGTEEDITERKRAEEALSTAEENYRLLFERAGEGILVAQDGKIVLSNPAGTAISGYSPEELSLQPFTEFIHPEDRELILDRHRRRLSGEDIPTSYDFRVVTRDGAIKTVNIGSTMISWEGRPASLNFLADVTVRRQAEDNIRKFKTISDNASYGTHIISPNATFLYVNRAYAEMHGYSPDELVGRHVSSCHTEQQMISVSRGMQEVLRDGGFTPREIWHLHRNGTEFLTLMSGTVIRDEEGQPQYLAATTVDITELKRLQELADRAHRLEAAGRIAGQVAHDFNNLLGPLVAYPGIIREELGEGHPVNAYLEPMEAAAQQMADINQQLLTLGRRGHYLLEPLNLNEVIRQVLKQIQPQYTNLAVVADLAADLMNISGGVAQMSRVMTNLMTNAIDAMQGIGTLTITSENWYSEEAQGKYGQIARGEYVKVTISDTGCGITEDVMPHVFEPFFTTKKTDRKRGSGLGLSVVHAVVEDHRGYVEIDSVAGKGTSIYLYFPITREEISHSDETIVSGGNESVLVVDDDAIQREVTLKLLQKLGYRAEAVDGGEAALQRLQSESFDLLILDMVMPGGLDGADTYRRAKELRLDQRAIIVSGFAESDRVSEVQRMGAGDFIKKPLTLKSLAVSARCELDREHVAEPAY